MSGFCNSVFGTHQFGPDRDMILRATFGFAVALAVFYGQGGAMPPALVAVKADIAATRPEKRLQLLASQTASAVAARFGTAKALIAHPGRARVLQP
jgi:hypothetical protein